MQVDSKHELGSVDDMTFLLDEVLHAFTTHNKLNNPTNRTHAKLFILTSKSAKS